MDIIQQITEQRWQQQRALVQEEERRIIADYTTAGKVEPQGISTAIRRLQAGEFLKPVENPQQLVIANATTAAVIRKSFDRETVEVIVTPAVETGTAYVVTNEELKNQLLKAIVRRGY